MFVKILLTCIIVLVCFSSLGSAIECYQCQSDINIGCLNVTKEQTYLHTDCSKMPFPDLKPNETPKKCISFKRDIGKGEVIVQRSCFFELPNTPYTDICMMPPKDHGRFFDCKVCDTDLCNSAFSSRSIIGLVTMLTMIVAIFAL